MYLVRTPALLKPLARDLVWHMPRTERAVYLTFDDGPIPEVTPWVLDQLARFQAKGTFFCIGRNAATHPDILARIRHEGHAVGNHTWDHPNGWRTEQRNYLRNVLQCQAITGTRLFRPPYGRLTLGQSKALSKRFRIIMWEVLSADFDTTLSGEGPFTVFAPTDDAFAAALDSLGLTAEELLADGVELFELGLAEGARGLEKQQAEQHTCLECFFHGCTGYTLQGTDTGREFHYCFRSTT